MGPLFSNIIITDKRRNCLFMIWLSLSCGFLVVIREQNGKLHSLHMVSITNYIAIIQIILI